MKYLLRFYDIGALICFCAMMACILTEVVSRNIINFPTAWAGEAARLFCVWCVFLGSASAWFRGTHIVINVLPRRLAGRVKLLLQLAIEIITAIFLVAVWFGTVAIMRISYPAKTTALDISISYFYLGFFIGFTGMILFHINTLRDTIRNLLKPQTCPEKGV